MSGSRLRRPGFRRATAVTLLIAVVAAGAAGAARSRTINGTRRNDVLRGTSAADTINGNAGNDKIYGLGGNDHLNGGPGNDIIVGGPGADVITCGSGTDTVSADPNDTVAADCETVHGAAPLASGGHYAGTTSQGELIGFDVASDRKTISNLGVFGDAQCPGLTAHHVGTTVGPVSVSTRGAFTAPVPTNTMIVGGTVSGSFDATHAAAGTFELDFSDPAGNCSTGPVSWTAQWTPLLLLPGHYTGVTDLTGTNNVSFDVGADGQTVSSLTITAKLSCQPGGSEIVHLGPSKAFPPVTSRTLVYSAGQSPTGSPLSISLSINFDAAGYFTGTTDLHTQASNQQGVTFDCDSGELDWQGGLNRP
jgi:hypothetical protein